MNCQALSRKPPLQDLWPRLLQTTSCWALNKGCSRPLDMITNLEKPIKNSIYIYVGRYIYVQGFISF